MRYACMLPLTIAGHTENVRFLVCEELSASVTLGKTWLKAQKVVHDHDLECLYIGDKVRRRVYLTNNFNNEPLETAVPSDFLKAFNTGARLNTRRKLKHLFENTPTFSFMLARCAKLII